MNRRRFLEWTLGVTTTGVVGPAVGATAPRLDSAYFRKMSAFDQADSSDSYIEQRDERILKTIVARLRRVQSTVGHGNFHLLGLDNTLRLARRFASIERFSREELEFLEKIFYVDAGQYGFYGDKVLSSLTTEVPKRDVVKVRGTGNYLLKGEPHALYERLRAQVGDDMVLTSGVRSIVKQAYLFLNRAVKTGGNLSQASRSLAPPGYSYHAVGDFDVGQRGFGRRNFTTAFANTDVYRRLLDLGYVSIRYPVDNPHGVRFEPWHIKVVS